MRLVSQPAASISSVLMILTPSTYPIVNTLAVVRWPYMAGTVTSGNTAIVSARRRALNDSMR